MNQTDWVHNPALKNIDSEKLQSLLSMAEQGKHLSQKELLPFLMAAASKSQSDHTTFSGDETELILNVLKQGKSKEEIEKIDRIRSLFSLMKRR